MFPPQALPWGIVEFVRCPGGIAAPCFSPYLCHVALPRVNPSPLRQLRRDVFTGYCAVSGSPVNPHDYNRYRLTLPLVSGGGKRRTGYMHYCCWPCVCDTQDFIRVDTKTVSTSDGERQYHFAVLGNPCQNPDDLDRPFLQPFDRRWTSIRQSAPEVRCGDNHTLIGATLSDHGYPIIAMFFDAEQLEDEVRPLC